MSDESKDKLFELLRWVPFIKTDKTIEDRVALLDFKSLGSVAAIGFDDTYQNYVVEYTYADGRVERYCLVLKDVAISFIMSLTDVDMKRQLGVSNDDILKDVVSLKDMETIISSEEDEDWE